MTVTHVLTIRADIGIASALEGLLTAARDAGAVHAVAGTNDAPWEFSGGVDHALVTVFPHDDAMQRYHADERHAAAVAALEEAHAVLSVVDIRDNDESRSGGAS